MRGVRLVEEATIAECAVVQAARPKIEVRCSTFIALSIGRISVLSNDNIILTWENGSQLFPEASSVGVQPELLTPLEEVGL